LGAASPENGIGAGFSFTGTGSEAGFADIAGGEVVTANPYPAQGSYPVPGIEVTAPTASSIGQYPAPGVDTSTGPYPGPGDPTQQVPYPAPDQSQTGSAYPPPQSSQPQATVPTPTPIPVTPTPTPLPTPIPLDARIIATDPSTVKLASGYMQLIEFFAYWDGYSKSMAPIINELEAQYVDQIVFVRLDVDDPATAFLKSELGYEQQPEYYLLDGDGTILAMWEGLVEMGEFTRVFNDVITQE
jgi:thiol-disulfide isomerase/thioredoxin